MRFNLYKGNSFEQKLLSWSAVGWWVFVSAFLWAPSRDGLQGVYALAFFLPMLLVLVSRKPDFIAYGGWISCSALLYAGFSALSSLWSGQPQAIGFFILQWCILAVWLCGLSWLFTRREFDLQKYMDRFLILCVLIIAVTLLYYYGLAFVQTADLRLHGWNVFRNPNEIGAMCGVVAMLSIVTAFQASTLTRIYGFYALAIIACIGLLASYSRAALVAFALMSFCGLVIIRPALKNWLLPLLVVLPALSLLLGYTHLFSGFDGRSVAIDDRLFIWRQVLEHSVENLAGGVGMTKNSNIIFADGRVFNHAHNAWLDTFYRTGLIGLLLALISLACVVKTIPSHPRLLPLYLWLGYGCICSLFDSRCFFWEIGAKWFFYWIPIGLLAASIAAASIRASQLRSKK
ncbi:MAG TPA: O-antigen ligase family protein [Cellvibrio sp.]|nr:O-antigen ligase family protein [Cellvibrio sp.]